MRLFIFKKYSSPLPRNIYWSLPNMLVLVVLMQNTSAKVKVTLPTETEALLGGSATLKCRYSGVTDPSSLVLKWEHRVLKDTPGSTIWTYDGRIDTDFNFGFQDKFEKVKRDIMKEHSIRLKRAELKDEGIYFCKVEYYGRTGYSGDKASMKLTILGMYRIMVKANMPGQIYNISNCFLHKLFCSWALQKCN